MSETCTCPKFHGDDKKLIFVEKPNNAELVITKAQAEKITYVFLAYNPGIANR